MINEHYAQRYCKDDISKIENYDKAIADNTQTWHLHHKLELTLDGEFAHSYDELKRFGMYFHRPYFELIFLTKAEHRRLHMNHRSDEHKRKLADVHKGRHRSEETKRKMSESAKRRWSRR